TPPRPQRFTLVSSDVRTQEQTRSAAVWRLDFLCPSILFAKSIPVARVDQLAVITSRKALRGKLCPVALRAS
ncbi:MAG: hypothetical protein Q8M16_07725, partial [Pirellulaceae bacterium]|nr:hypothetical protein [Pirellulaceae bacterium]